MWTYAQVPINVILFMDQSASVQLRGSIPVCVDVNKTGKGLVYVQQINWNRNSACSKNLSNMGVLRCQFGKKDTLLPISRTPYSWISQQELPGLYVRDTWNIFVTIFNFYHHRQTEQIFPSDSENAVSSVSVYLNIVSYLICDSDFAASLEIGMTI